MSDQLSFLDPAPSRPLTDSLFFALFPVRVRDAMRLLAERQRERHTLMGRLLQADRLHLSLIGLGEYAELPERAVQIARSAGDTVAAAPFDIVVDRVESFSTKPGHCPRVLRCSEGLDGIASLYQALVLALKGAGHTGKVPPPGTPHITLMYADRAAATDAIDPVRWTADEFVLVHSLLGKTTYNVLGRWPLRR